MSKGGFDCGFGFPGEEAMDMRSMAVRDFA